MKTPAPPKAESSGSAVQRAESTAAQRASTGPSTSAAPHPASPDPEWRGSAAVPDRHRELALRAVRVANQTPERLLALLKAERAATDMRLLAALADLRLAIRMVDLLEESLQSLDARIFLLGEPEVDERLYEPSSGQDSDDEALAAGKSLGARAVSCLCVLQRLRPRISTPLTSRASKTCLFRARCLPSRFCRRLARRARVSERGARRSLISWRSESRRGFLYRVLCMFAAREMQVLSCLSWSAL